jgi:RNA polymerase sigma-70 factor (ECF subfamily)
MFTIVRRKLANWRRGRRSLPGRILLEGSPVEYLAASDVEAAWEAEWERRVFSWACEQVRQDDADATWQAFWRTAVEGQPGKRVAADLGLSVGPSISPAVASSLA